MKKSLVIIALSIFILTSAIAIACDCEEGKCNCKEGKCNCKEGTCNCEECNYEENEKDPSFIGSVNFRDITVHFLDHTNSPKSGNWIVLGIPAEERSIQLPKDMKFTYSGPKSIDYRDISAVINKGENERYLVRYPSTSPYKTWPVYLPGENVKMSFFGETSLREEQVEIYLLKITTDPANKMLEAYRTGDTQDLRKLFHITMDGNYQKYVAKLDKKGDLVDYELGPLEEGQYSIVMLQKNEEGKITVISSTAFVVAEYQLFISSPKSIKEGKDLDISLDLKDAPEDLDCTYAALLINEERYKAEVKVNSDGTIDGTSITVNDLDLLKEFGIDPDHFNVDSSDSSNYKSKIAEEIDREDIREGILSFIEEGEGCIAVGEPGQKKLSLTAFELSEGDYYLLVGAYYPGKGIVGLAQSEVEIVESGTGLEAKFSANPTTGEAPLNVQFTDESTNANHWKWDFNDGTTSTDQSPAHTYNDPGQYTVSLKVSDGTNEDTITGVIDVKEPGTGLEAKFSANPTTGEAPLNVQFTDESTNANHWKWDFGDGNIDTAQSPAHTYNDPGRYTVSLKVSDGTNEDTITGVIDVKKPTTINRRPNGGSGGGGSIGSSEPTKNIYAKEICEKYISDGDIIKFEFKKGATPIDYIQFKSKKTVGKTKATVEDLKEKSALTPDEPEGEIYKHVNIWIGKNNFANSNNIENAVVGFKVSKDWVDKNHIDINSLVLQHFNNKKWTALPTQKTGEDQNYIRFEAKALSFSPFAISAQKNVMSIEKGTDGKTPSKDETNGKTGTNTQKETSSEENKDQTIFKVAAFFTGLAIVLIIGAVVLRKK